MVETKYTWDELNKMDNIPNDEITVEQKGYLALARTLGEVKTPEVIGVLLNCTPARAFILFSKVADESEKRGGLCSSEIAQVLAENSTISEKQYLIDRTIEGLEKGSNNG